MKRFLLFFLVCLMLMRTSFITGCANMIPPSGGPKDSLPPVLIYADPQQHALKVTDDQIELNFDEYIDLKNIRDNLIVSPVPKIMPTVTSHLKVIRIHIRDTIQPNTTYSFNFGRAVADVNEGNILKNFTYTISSGTYVDSMIYSGRVLMAYTGRPDSTLIAMLYDSLYDSAVAKIKPRYIARLDSSGNFTFRFIKPGTYSLFALKDESGMHMYTSKAEVFAFANDPIEIGQNPEPATLYAYADTSDYAKNSPKKTLLPPKPTKKEIKQEKEKVKRLIIAGNLANGQLDLHDQLELSFATPIKSYDSSKIRFTTDSFETITKYHYSLDSLSKKLTLFYAWKENTLYHLILQKDFAEDTLGERLLKIDTISFRTKKETDYGILRLRFKNLDYNRHPVLLFILNDKIFMSTPIGRSLRYNNKLFIPGTYELRVLFDTNQNGIWDPGDYFNHRQPEIVVPVKKKLTVRSDWENEVDVIL